MEYKLSVGSRGYIQYETGNNVYELVYIERFKIRPNKLIVWGKIKVNDEKYKRKYVLRVEGDFDNQWIRNLMLGRFR